MKPRIGFVGLGKLGLPVSLALNSYGFDVCGTDLNPDVEKYLVNKEIPYKEVMADQLLKHHTIVWYNTIPDVVRNSDVIFVPVQTPHDPKYEGITRLPKSRVDFDYSYLIDAVNSINWAVHVSSDPSPKTVVIISTVLPGTIEKHIKPLIKNENRILLVYNPFFIAMGTVIPDFLNPEFVLIGVEEDDYYAVPNNLLHIYEKTYGQAYIYGDNPFYQVMSIPSAELCKVAYNTYITSKICIVNTLGEICHKTSANIDDITNALKQATSRIVSTKYMDMGMGDGGGCHPRDNIAMSWLAKELNLSYDWFENLMISREKQAEFFVDLIREEQQAGDQVYILGYEFKPETELTVGSHALLVYEILKEYGIKPILLQSSGSEYYEFEKINGKHIIFIGCKQEKFKDFNFHFPYKSVVIDPFRYIPDQSGVKVIRIGE